MKLSHAITLIALLTGQCASLAYASTSVNGIYQFDKSTIINQKLKKAQECINNGNYSGAKNYLNGVLKLDPNNARAKELLAVCNTREKSVSSSRSNSSSSNSNNSVKSNSTRAALSVSKNELYFSSYGGSETLTVTSGSVWTISMNPTSWGHLSRSGNTLTLKVDPNSLNTSRTDYFKLKSGNQEVKVNITQAGLQYNSSPYLNVSKTAMFFASDGGQESITISSNNTWRLSTNTNSWGHLKQEGNTLTLSVDANYTGNQRTDYFVLSAGGIEKRINITQSQTFAKNGLSMSGTTRAYLDNAKALDYLSTSIQGWKKCRLGAITESGAGIVVYGSNGYATKGNLNGNLVAKIKELNNQKETFKSIAITNSGYYCVVYGRNGWYGYMPERLKTILNQYNSNKEDIYCVSIAENGDFIVISDKHYFASNTTDMSYLKKACDKYGLVKYASVTNRGLIVVCEKGILYNNIPTNLEVKLKSINFQPDKVVFTDSGTYLITNESESFCYYM